MATKKTQLEKVLSHLKRGKQLTVSEALSRYGVQRLAARIYDLRQEGFIIYTNDKKLKGGPNRGKRVTAYCLDGSQRD